MRNLVILLAMLLCLFGPTALFTIVGYKAMTDLGKRPSVGGALMIALITKLVIMAAVLIGVLMVLLKFFAS